MIPLSAYPDELIKKARRAESDCAPVFAGLSALAEENTARVLRAFIENRVSSSHFAPTTGYGYDDAGRDTLDRVFACAFGAEDALVRPGFINGTHTIATALFALLRPGDTLLSATGSPYDTLLGVIGTGTGGEGPSSLAAHGVSYSEYPLGGDLGEYLSELAEKVKTIKPRAALLSRSRGYSLRRALTCAELCRIYSAIKAACPECVVIVDNCYGEFTETSEPCAGGADLICGSLIKNPGGGLAPTGGYVAGRAELVSLCAERLGVPGIGREAGCNPYGHRLYFQGLFMAPHVTAEALKTAVFSARLFELMGYQSFPGYDAPRSDIIQTLVFGAPEPMLAFMAGIQAASPVDSFAVPEPWAMPGYDDPVVMAAGTFVQGASIELSADAPMREPYAAYIQGGLSYPAGKAAVMAAAARIMQPGR